MKTLRRFRTQVDAYAAWKRGDVLGLDDLQQVRDFLVDAKIAGREVSPDWEAALVRLDEENAAVERQITASRN